MDFRCDNLVERLRLKRGEFFCKSHAVTDPSRPSLPEDILFKIVRAFTGGSQSTASERGARIFAHEADLVHPFPCRRWRGSSRRIPTFPQTAGNRLLGVIQVHIGL